MLLTGSLSLLAQLAFSYNSEVALPTATGPSHIVINQEIIPQAKLMEAFLSCGSFFPG